MNNLTAMDDRVCICLAVLCLVDVVVGAYCFCRSAYIWLSLSSSPVLPLVVDAYCMLFVILYREYMWIVDNLWQL